jgi:hypothetical protein
VRPSSSLAAHRDEVLRLAHDFGLKNPRVFGSAARGEDLPGSDLDLLVTVPRGKACSHSLGLRTRSRISSGCTSTWYPKEGLASAMLRSAATLSRCDQPALRRDPIPSNPLRHLRIDRLIEEIGGHFGPFGTPPPGPLVVA